MQVLMYIQVCMYADRHASSMYASMCVCIYVCIDIYIQEYKYIFMLAGMHEYACMCACMYADMQGVCVYVVRHA